MSQGESTLRAYFKDWPKNTCHYMQDLMYAMNIGVQYINRVKTQQTAKPKCVVFDFDDCLIFGDPAQVYGLREMELGEHDGSEIFIFPTNNPILKIAEHAKQCGISVIILTARPPTSREATKWNCMMFKIPYDAIIMNEGDADPCFKINTRRKIAEKYHICMTIGDQITDCLCPGANTAFIKLPDPGTEDKNKNAWVNMSLATYAWIPPE